MARATDGDWIDVGAVSELSSREVQQVMAGNIQITLTYKDGTF